MAEKLEKMGVDFTKVEISFEAEVSVTDLCNTVWGYFEANSRGTGGSKVKEVYFMV